MIKEIIYSGLSANGSPYSSPDGSLSLAFNCVNEDGTLNPVFEPKVLMSLQQNQSCLYVHTVDSIRHFIILEIAQGTEDDAKLFFVVEGDNELNYFKGTPRFKEVHSISSIGNILTVLSDIGISYFIWTGSGYDYIGEHMPELDLSFSLNYQTNYYSDIFSVEPEDGISQNETAANPGYAEQWQMVRTAMHAAANSLIAKISKEHYFTFPFFIRYAYRLFDGSVTMQSAPILLVPSFDCISLDMGWVDRVTGNRPFYAKAAKVKASAGVYSIACKIISAVSRLKVWKNIISSIDFFISPQFYTYDSNADISVPDAISGRLPRRNVAPDIVGSSNFYLIKSISIDELLSTYGSQSSFEINPDFSVNNDNIVVRETLPDDYNSHNSILPRLQHVYNSRLNVANIKERFYHGYSPASLYSAIALTKNVEATYNVCIKSNQGEWTITAPQSQSIQVDKYYNILWFYYPNIRAKYVVFHIKECNDSGDIVFEEYQKYYLKPHTLLNGSYFFLYDNTAESTKVLRPSPTEISRSVDGSVSEATDEPIVSDVDYLFQPNSIFTSEVNNPFAFPLLGINSIGSGEIIGITSATKALSQGQFGQFPLYAFCTDGVWALEPAADGTFTTKQAVSRDVCTNTASITQLDNSVAFASARGIMHLQGSQCECLSDILGTERSFFAYDVGKDSFDILLHEAGYNLSSNEIYILPFPKYAANCQMVFDYIHQRLIVFNPSWFYSYVYSLKSNLWGMYHKQKLIKQSINSYTDALAVIGNNVVDFSQPGTDNQHILVVSNPINLDSPDFLKTIRTIAQRGFFKKNNVQQILYGSRDLRNWHAVSSSTSEFLRGWRGTPYKFFRIAFTANLKRGESVSGCQILFEQRYTNRIR